MVECSNANGPIFCWLVNDAFSDFMTFLFMNFNPKEVIDDLRRSKTKTLHMHNHSTGHRPILTVLNRATDKILLPQYYINT